VEDLYDLRILISGLRSTYLAVAALHRLSHRGDYFFLDLPFGPTLVSENVLVPFLPYRPYDYSRGEDPIEVHLFLFIVVLFLEIDGCGNVTSDPVGLAEDTCRPIPKFCSVGAFVEEVVCCFFLGLTKMTS
jgi:hypothetical protein